jgi:acetyl-CoA C-acetyltransferase
VIVKTRKGETVFDTDERPMDTDMDKMAKLRPAFKKGGTVTAGNSSGINDAAAAVLLMSTDKAKDLSLEPIVKIKAFASGGVDPAYMGLGPVPAVRKALTAAGMTLEDIDMIERLVLIMIAPMSWVVASPWGIPSVARGPARWLRV